MFIHKRENGGPKKSFWFSLGMGIMLISMVFAVCSNCDLTQIVDLKSEYHQEPQEKSISTIENEHEDYQSLLGTTETHSFRRETRSGEEDLDILLKWLDGYGTIIGYMNSIKSADVDNDNETEIVFGNSEGYVYVVGNSNEGFVEEWSTMVGIYAFGLSLDDVDNDGIIEIVVGNRDGYINIFGFNGSTYALEWTSPNLGSDLYGLTTADVDDDGVIEIIAGCSVSVLLDDNLFVYSWQGSTYEEEWSFALTITLGFIGLFHIEVGDVDGDSSKEIVIGSYESEMIQNDPPVNPIPPNPRPTGQFGGRFYIFGYTHGSGSLEWQSDDFGEWIMGLGLGDTDSDFRLEIIITVYLGEIYVFGYNGLVYLTEWQSNGLSAYALTVGGVNRTNPFDAEIIISSWDNIFVYQYSNGVYEESWASPLLDSFVYGLGCGVIDRIWTLEILIGTNFKFNFYGFENNTYVRIGESNNIGAMESISSGDLDRDGSNEIFLGTGNGSVLVSSFDGNSLEMEDLISLSTTIITHLAVADVDDDGDTEIIAVEGHTYTSWNENFVFRSAGGDCVVYIIGYGASNYVVEDQINVDVGGAFTLDVGDVDNDDIPEILLGGTGYDEVNEDPFVGQIEVIDYDGSGYDVVWESNYYDNWVMGVAIGDVDDDGLNEIVTEDYDSNLETDLLRFYEWTGVTYVEFKTLDIDSENFALDMGDIDNDGSEEIVTKGIFDGLLTVFGWTGTSHIQEWSSGQFTTFIDECFGISNLEDGGDELLIFGELGVFIYEHTGSNYQEIWHSAEIPASIKTLHVANVDSYGGKEIIGSSGGYNFIYGEKGGPIAILTVSDDLVEVGDLVVFNGSLSTGQSKLDYFFDFGDGTNTGWISSPIVSYSYSTAGTYDASLKVRDETLTESGVSSKPITVLFPNEIPKAFIDSISPNPALKDEEVTLEGHGEDDIGIISYDWYSSIDGFIDDNATVKTDQLSLGTHTIIFKVQDTDLIWSDEVSATLKIHEKPLALIDDISPNPARQGVEVSFVGHGSDDGTIIAYEWYSSINGFLSDAPSFNHSTLSLGEHGISFRVKDDDGVWSDEALSNLRINKVPTAHIESISPSPAKGGESVTFKGYGTDDTDIVGYIWRSSIDDFLSNKASFTTSELSIGQHTIYFMVEDSDGEWSEEASMNLLVNQIPVAYIDSISPNPTFLGEFVTFEGHGTDDESIFSYNWESDIDDFLSSKSSFTTSLLSVGVHTITFKVKDNRGVWSEGVTETLIINENPENDIPTAYIDSISPSASKEGEYVTFIGHGIDEDGDISEYLWESDMDGFLSDARSFTTPDLSEGTHVISFRVRDDRGDWSESAQTTIVVEGGEEEAGYDLSGAFEDPWLLLFLIIVILVLIVAITAALSRKKGKEEEYQVQIGGFDNLGTRSRNR